MLQVFAIVPVVLTVIVVVDYWLGPTAEYLNAYEILRLTLAPQLPQTAKTFIVGQQQLGRFALAVGWLAWMAEATAASAVLVGLTRFVRFLVVAVATI